MKFLSTVAVAAMLFASALSPALAADAKVKARLDHFRGTSNVLVISTLPDEITSITCERWVMLGIGSWDKQNEFTIPAVNADYPVALAVMNADGFNGHCTTPGSIVAHTDSGDHIGTLDMGPGNWTDSTKLIFSTAK